MALVPCCKCGKGFQVKEKYRYRDGQSCEECKVPCNHKWVDMEDGSYDRFCVRCSKKGMQTASTVIPNDVRHADQSVIRNKFIGLSMVPKELLIERKEIERNRVPDELTEYLLKQRNKMRCDQ